MPPSSTESAAMVAEPGDKGIHILAKTLNGNTITLDITDINTVKELKQKIKENKQLPEDQQVLTYNGKNMEDDKNISYYNIQKGDMIQITSRLQGGLTEQDVANMMNMFRDQLTQMQVQLQEEKDKSEQLRKQVQNKNHDQGGVISAIRKGQMKDISPNKITNLQTSGNFKSWSKTMKDFIFWHDKDSQQLLEYFEENWLLDERISYKDVQKICDDREMGVQEDATLHMVIGAFLEGESKVLADTSELTDMDAMQTHKSGLDLWRQLKYNFDRSSAFNVITILENIRSMSQVKNVQDVLPKIAILEKAQQ